MMKSCHINKFGKEYFTLHDRISNILNILADRFQDFVWWFESLDMEKDES